MFSQSVTAGNTDDPQFIGLVARIITGAVVVHPPPEVRIFKVDHWFDHKWQRFSGKSWWSCRLTVPPFVANRLIDQWLYAREESTGEYRLVGPGPNIHHRGSASENLNRRVSQIAPSAALFWYSGDTLTTGRGSLMAYMPVEDDFWPWFLSMSSDGGWRVTRRQHIHEYEVRMFQQAGENVATG